MQGLPCSSAHFVLERSLLDQLGGDVLCNPSEVDLVQGLQQHVHRRLHPLSVLPHVEHLEEGLQRIPVVHLRQSNVVLQQIKGSAVSLPVLVGHISGKDVKRAPQN